MNENCAPIDLQQSFWNEWNSSTREKRVDAVSLEQAQVILSWLDRLGRRDLEILEVGCGAGWLCAQLTRYGRVTATDLSDQVLARAAKRVPQAKFIAGDFMELPFEENKYDAVVSLEVLSHVSRQREFLQKIARILKPGGHLMLATQNRPVLERNSIPPVKPGQLRRWVDRTELVGLLADDLEVTQLFSITPRFNRGPLRLVNSYKLGALATKLRLHAVVGSIKAAQERRWLGWTLMLLARKPVTG